VKAIYVKIGNNVYRVRQNTSIPTTLTAKAPGVSSSLNIDSYNKTVTQNVYINNLKKPGTKSNSELYNELVNFLKLNKVTEIKEVQNFFKIYVDYSAYEDGREIEHSAVIRPLAPMDKVVLLGVATNNECVYRRVKTFDPKIEFKLNNSLPHGIMSTQKTTYELKIHNIAIFQDFSNQHNVHESTYDVAYSIGSSTIQSSLDNMKIVYSTANEGINIQSINLSFMPRKIAIALDITLADYVVVYDDTTINKILVENIEAKYPPVEEEDPPVIPEEPEVPDVMIPDDDYHENGDGEYDPNDDGYFSYYERCTSTTPNRLLVVEDLTPDGYYNQTTMIKKFKVVPDIEDIEVGEYVIFRESLTCLA
jgi:hypothetical protein